MTGKVKCTCGWSWNKSDSSKKDMYICHECGRDNSNNMKDGGWLDNYNDYNVSAPEGMEGDGYSNVGRNSSPAWGGQFQMGGNLPGAVGNMYARTGSPSKGPRRNQTDVTDASAQNGKEMQYYQNGLDWKPKSISKNGAWLDNYEEAQNGKKFKLKDERESAYKTAESTNVKKKNFDLEQSKSNKSYINQLAEQQKENKRRKVLTQDQREREDYNARNEERGSIQAPVKESKWDRTKAIVSNPLTAFGYAARNESLPTRFQHGERNTLDNAIDWINPLQGIAAASEIPGELGRGEYLNAGLSLLDAADLGVYAKGARKALGTKSGLLSNAYKLNPYAKGNKFNSWNPDNYYRAGDKRVFLDDVLNSNKIKVYNENSYANLRKAGKSTSLRQDGVISLKAKDFPEADAYFAKGRPLDGRGEGIQKYGDHVIEVSNDTPFIHAVNQRTRQPGFWDNPDFNYNDTHVTGNYVKPRQSYSYNAEGKIQASIGTPLEYDSNTMKLWEPHWLQGYKEVPKQEDGGIIKDDRGQWDHPGEITEIGSNEITMEGVPYDVLGVSDTGDAKLMKPGKNYKFKGKKVTEYPMAKNGVNQQDQKTLQQLDQLTNFTNYNKPTIGGWLNKYN